MNESDVVEALATLVVESITSKIDLPKFVDRVIEGATRVDPHAPLLPQLIKTTAQAYLISKKYAQK